MNALRGRTQAMHDNGLHYKRPHETTGERLKTEESSLCFREDLLLPIEASPVSAHCHDALQRIAIDSQLWSYVPRRGHSACATTYFSPLRHPHFHLTPLLHYQHNHH